MSAGTESEYATLGLGRFKRYRDDEPPVMATHFDIGGGGQVCFVRADESAACLAHDNLPPLGTPEAGVVTIENVRSAYNIAVDPHQVCVLHEDKRVTCFTTAGRRTARLPRGSRLRASSFRPQRSSPHEGPDNDLALSGVSRK